VAFKAVWNVIFASFWVLHRSEVFKLIDCLKFAYVLSIKLVKTSLLNELSYDLKSHLITPLVDKWHVNIVHEENHLFALRRSVDVASTFEVTRLFNRLLEGLWCSS